MDYQHLEKLQIRYLSICAQIGLAHKEHERIKNDLKKLDKDLDQVTQELNQANSLRNRMIDIYG